MEMVFAVAGFVVAVIAAILAAWTAWESTRSADAALTSAEAAKASAQASQQALQLESERFDWERKAKLVLTDRRANSIADSLTDCANDPEWPNTISFTVRNVGRAPAVGISVEAIYMRDMWMVPDLPIPQSLDRGETMELVFRLPNPSLKPGLKARFTLYIEYRDTEEHELAVGIHVHSHSYPHVLSADGPNPQGDSYATEIKSATFDARWSPEHLRKPEFTEEELILLNAIGGLDELRKDRRNRRFETWNPPSSRQQ